MFEKWSNRITIIFFFAFSSMKAQSILCTGGGDLKNNNGEVSFTIGSIDFSAIESSEYDITGGIQQPFELFLNSIIIQDAIPEIKFYPNPVSAILTIELSKLQHTSYNIINQLGQSVIQGKLEYGNTTLNLTHLTPGIYYFQFQNSFIKSLKFTKL